MGHLSGAEPGAPRGGPVTLSGAATDDVGVTQVDVSIKDRTTGLWLRADGSWGAFVWISTVLASPNARSTTWTFTFQGSTGLYTVAARARDATKKYDKSLTWVRFSVSSPPPPPPPPTTRPNIVLILTDDQCWDSLSVLPNVQSLIAAHGVTFSNGFVVDPLCCPSRAAILKGAYAHSTGVYNNLGPYSPFVVFDDRSTIATWLQGAGHRTGANLQRCPTI